MPTTQVPQETESDLRRALRRCSEATIEAAIQFRQTQDPAAAVLVATGVIERFVEPEVRPRVLDGTNETRLIDDLGIDSLLMVEIIVCIEDALQIRIENDELRELQTLGDLRTFLEARASGRSSPLRRRSYNLEQVAATLPHRTPFLFLHSVIANGKYAEGTFAVEEGNEYLVPDIPGQQQFPASLMLEALGQLAVFKILRSERPEFASASEGRVLFVSCDGVRCHRPARPGENLRLRVDLQQIHLPLVQFSGRITIGEETIAEADRLSVGLYPKNA